ncbi:MAG: transposase [Bermanella sp.]
MAQTLLPDFQDYLQTDDYVGYNKIAKTEGVTQLDCFTHARRKFIDTQKVALSKNGKASKTDMAVQIITKLYVIEKNQKKVLKSGTIFINKKADHN